jgi:hypothetical protein
VIVDDIVKVLPEFDDESADDVRVITSVRECRKRVHEQNWFLLCDLMKHTHYLSVIIQMQKFSFPNSIE